MKFYEVWVSSPSFHGKEPLTYSSEELLEAGRVVTVPLQRKTVLGIIARAVSKPPFATKPLSSLLPVAHVPVEHLDLIEWLISYYPAPTGQITSLFLPSNLSQQSRIKPTSTKEVPSDTALPALTQEQTLALDTIGTGVSKSYLLHGDTGTGKTRVYIELTKKTLQNGRSAIILTPEIGLTPQLTANFEKQFPGQVEIIHSHLTPAQRRDSWLRIAGSSTTPLVVIGPRSALFSPLSNVGLVVVDEAHDSAYKQEQAPHYHASKVAAKLAGLHNSKLILGSATPSVADYYTFETKNLPIIRMTQSAVTTIQPKTSIDIVDLTDRENFSRSAWLSNTLLAKVEKGLKNSKQSLIFLNRRGSARTVLCENCGWHALCPKCDIPLTYHGDKHRMLCHTCGFIDHPLAACPECKQPDVVYKSIGTKALTQEIERLFPHARIARFDSDNLKDERLEHNHQSLQDGGIDILVGTQTLIKGLDLPKLAVVGIITADTALSFPDFTAEEITYQQLSQVIGRVGRGHTDGSVVIQTYYPENKALEAIVNKNYSLFYQQQISEREKFLFPPFSYILKLKCGRKTFASAQKACQNLRTHIRSLPLAAEIIGPSPAFKEKQNDIYYWQLIVKAKKRQVLVDIINQLPSKVSYDIDPLNLL